MFEHQPPHPGEILREDILPSLGLSRAELARRLGITPRRLAAILSEKQPITLDVARRLGAVVGYGPRYWLGMQIQFDIWLAEAWGPMRLEPIHWRRQPPPPRTPLRVGSGQPGAAL